MSHRHAAFAVNVVAFPFTAFALAAVAFTATARAESPAPAPAPIELSLPPQISPGVPALLTEPTVPAAEADPAAAGPGPRDPQKAPPSASASTTTKPAKKKKKGAPNGKRVQLDLARRGSRQSMGMAFRFFDHLDVGYSGLLGRTVGSEVHATLFANVGKLRPMVTAGVPFYMAKGAVRTGLRALGGVEWRPIKFVGIYANFSASYFGKALAKVEKSVLMPSAGLFLYL